jgi:glycogen operon protein
MAEDTPAESVPILVTPGERYPLGATCDGFGTNFAVFSEVAGAVELCLFAQDGTETRVPMPEVDGFVWHVYLPGVVQGTRYGYRVHGPWAPQRGLWCNPDKLLADPYAHAFAGQVVDHPALIAHDVNDRLRPSPTDSAPYTKRSVVVATGFEWGTDRPPRVPYNETVVYEAHVRGLTLNHPSVGARARGTYLGLAHPTVIEHLLRLGVTAVELLPVHQSVTEWPVARRGLTNFWGYNTFGYFAPHRAYAASPTADGAVAEFKVMVRELHAAGIEVILDVVFNHTAEGGTDGPTYSLRGLDNPAYYRLDPADRSRYIDTTGVGNSLNMSHPMALRLVMDSLRYWVTEMHVDGFRFDLASTLARELAAVDKLSSFFDIVAQDPVISQVKLIAEPWDLGEGGYQVGNFPPLWTEWNGIYRDTVRDYWRGRPGTVPGLASRFAGSSDLYGDDGRRPVASINFVTAHDGFTLRDLVSYERKHNEANGEGNRDGTDDNRSANNGVEGPTDDPAILEVRARQQRNFLATLFLSQGVPMLLGGDERNRTQLGNNNAYCQDNPVSWVDWAEDPAATDLEAFAARVSRLRRDHPVFRRKRFLRGVPVADGDLPDVVWLRADGREMTGADWGTEFARSLVVFLNGEALTTLDRWARPVRDDSFLVLFNAWDQDVLVTLPPARFGTRWAAVLDTTHPRGASAAAHSADETLTLRGRALLVLTRVA